MEIVAFVLGLGSAVLLVMAGLTVLRRPSLVEMREFVPFQPMAEPDAEPEPPAILDAAQGTAREPWARAARRLGIESSGRAEAGVRATLHYLQAVWSAIHGPDRPASPIGQRLAATIVLTDAELLRRVEMWEASAMYGRNLRAREAEVERDALFHRVAAVLSAQAQLTGRR